jgi:carbon-monoxide dehydrogenase medium subunit
MTFDFHQPTSLDEATGLLARHDADAIALAGGTAVVLLLQQGLIKPLHVVGLGGIAELRGIRDDGRGLWIGALATHREVERSAAVRAAHPMLADAFSRIATIRIRHQATIGGNLAHADPSQDPPPALIALDATVDIAGPRGARREVPVAELFVDQLETSLLPGELIVGVRVPAAAGSRATFLKYLPRSADDYATVSAAAALRLAADGTVDHIRIALGSVGPTPVRARRAEAALQGGRPTPDRIRDAADLVRGEIEPIDDARGSAGYKTEMARVFTERALLRLIA